jgi:hypothetical protein
MCARIGIVTGRGLAARLRQKIPRWMLIIVTLALFCANSINVGSDLSGMADAAEMLTGLNSHWFVITFGVGIAYWAVGCRYFQIAMILKPSDSKQHTFYGLRNWTFSTGKPVPALQPVEMIK